MQVVSGLTDKIGLSHEKARKLDGEKFYWKLRTSLYMEQFIFYTGEVWKPLKMLYDIKNCKVLVQLITNIGRYAKPFKMKFQSLLEIALM